MKKEPKKVQNQESLIPLVSAIPDNLELVGFYPYNENKPAEKKEIKQQTQEVSNQNNIDDSEEDDNSLDENDKEELKQISMDEFDKANKIEHPIKSYEKKVIKPINNDLTNVQNFQQMIIEVILSNIGQITTSPFHKMIDLISPFRLEQDTQNRNQKSE
jgi:L,D-transpeptidase YcfS